MSKRYVTYENTLPPYSPPKPATSEQIERELKLFRRKKIQQSINRYINLLFKIGGSSSWDFMEDLALFGFLKQHTPVHTDYKFDEDINFYIDFQYALWELEEQLRIVFALRYIWRMKDREVACHLQCARRTILRKASEINKMLYDSLRDYFIHEEKQLLDILQCRF